MSSRGLELQEFDNQHHTSRIDHFISASSLETWAAKAFCCANDTTTAELIRAPNTSSSFRARNPVTLALAWPLYASGCSPKRMYVLFPVAERSPLYYN